MSRQLRCCRCGCTRIRKVQGSYIELLSWTAGDARSRGRAPTFLVGRWPIKGLQSAFWAVACAQVVLPAHQTVRQVRMHARTYPGSNSKPHIVYGRDLKTPLARPDPSTFPRADLVLKPRAGLMQPPLRGTGR